MRVATQKCCEMPFALFQQLPTRKATEQFDSPIPRMEIDLSTGLDQLRGEMAAGNTQGEGIIFNCEPLSIAIENIAELDRLLYEMAGLEIFQQSSIPREGVFNRTVTAAARRIIDTLGPFALPLRKGTTVFYSELCAFGRALLHRIVTRHSMTLSDVLVLATSCLAESVASSDCDVSVAGVAAAASTSSIKGAEQLSSSQLHSHLSPPPKLVSCNYLTMRKEDPHRLGILGIAVLLVSATHPCRYKSVEELLSVYPEFSASGHLDLAQLLENANFMSVAISFVTPMQNKGVLLSIVPRLCEGGHVKYVTGGGSSRATLDRVAIFEREGNCSVRRRSVGPTSRTKRKTGHELAHRRVLVRKRLQSQGLVVSNAELMRRARESLDTETEEAFADLVDSGGNLVVDLNQSTKVIVDEKPVFSGNTSPTSSTDRAYDSASNVSSPRRDIEGQSSNRGTSDGAVPNSVNSKTRQSSSFVVHGEGGDTSSDHDEDEDEGNDETDENDAKCKDTRGNKESNGPKSTSSNRVDMKICGVATATVQVGPVQRGKRQHLGRPPAFFAVDSIDGFAVSPMGSLAALHFGLACALEPVDLVNSSSVSAWRESPTSRGFGENANSYRHGAAGPRDQGYFCSVGIGASGGLDSDSIEDANISQYELQHTWSDALALWPLADLSGLSVTPLNRHPSQVVDNVVQEQLPPPKPVAARREDVYSGDFVYGASLSGTASRPRTTVSWKSEGAPRGNRAAAPKAKRPRFASPAVFKTSDTQINVDGHKAMLSSSPSSQPAAWDILLNLATASDFEVVSRVNA